MRNLNFQVIKDLIIVNLKKEFALSGFSKAVLGLSGGIDSALAAFLVAEAIGADNLICVKLPYKASSPESLTDADLVLQKLGINGKKVEITPIVDAFVKMIGHEISPLRLGNIIARCRMITLFDISASENALVIGTSNKSELLLGYGTLWGDLAAIINPLGRLYKSEVKNLAKLVGVPDSIISKPPSADLETGQTDEGDFGFTYAEADSVLYGLYENNRSEVDLENYGVGHALIKKVTKRVKASSFKSRVPIIIEID